jgi:predicted PurR-regulated permease PerM
MLLFVLFAAKSVVFGVLISLILFPLCSLMERGLARMAEKRLKKTWKGRSLRATAVSLSYLIAVIVVGIIVASALPLLYQNYAELQATLTGYVNALLKLLQQNEFIYELIVSLVGASGQTAQEFINNLLMQYSGYLSSFAGNLINLLTTVIMSTSDVLVALILAFYFLLARDTIVGLTRKIAAAVLPDKFRLWSARFFRRFYTNVIEFLSARLLCSFLLGVLCYLLTWALSIPFYPLLSLIVFILNIIPFFGPIIAALLCTVIIFIVQPEVTWIFILIVLLINLTEQFLIERSLLSKRLRPSTGVILVSVMLFNHYFGFVGAIFAVPIWVTVASELNGFLNRRLRKKEIVPPANEMPQEQASTEACECDMHVEKAALEPEEADLPEEAEYEATWRQFKAGCVAIWSKIKAFFSRIFKKKRK